MSFEKIQVGNFGQVARITFKDIETDLATYISQFATQEMIFTYPDGTAVTKTAAFDDDGIDGIIKYTVDDGLFSISGFWRVRGVARGGSSYLATEELTFFVDP